MRAVYERIRKVAPSDCTVLVAARAAPERKSPPARFTRTVRARGPVRRRELRRAARDAARERALRPREGRLHRRRRAQERAASRPPTAARCSSTRSASSPPALQAKLLRVLAGARSSSASAAREPIKVDVRVVAATNRDLAGRGRRRALPRGPLLPPQRRHARRCRRCASAATTSRCSPAHFAGASTARGRTRSSSRAEALDALSAYDWPGNVRELENAIERALVLGCNGRIVADDLPETIVDASPALPGGAVAAFHQTVLETKRRLILGAIDRTGGNYTAAARLLGINPDLPASSAPQSPAEGRGRTALIACRAAGA